MFLFDPPRKVLIDNGGQTECFFKPCTSTVQTINELAAFKKIVAATNLDPAPLHICRLHDVVLDDYGTVSGLLLTYIDHVAGDTLASRAHPVELATVSVRERWVSQLETAIGELHRAGIVWGDVKPDNVLVDRNDNAWIIDFGGGYTRGWVDGQLAGTVEGDLEGMAKIKEFILDGKNPGDDVTNNDAESIPP